MFVEALLKAVDPLHILNDATVEPLYACVFTCWSCDGHMTITCSCTQLGTCFFLLQSGGEMIHLEEAMMIDVMTEGGVAMDETGTMSPRLMAQEGGTDMMEETNTVEETGAMTIAMVMTDGNMIGMRIMVQGGVGGAIHPLAVGEAIHPLGVGEAIHPLGVGGAIHLLGVGGDMNPIEVGGTILLEMGTVGRRETDTEVRGCTV